MQERPRNIIVVGASAGGFEAIKTLVAGLPPDFPASVLIVWHISPDIRGILPKVLNRYETLNAAHAEDHEPIAEGRIYIAPPDRHLLVEDGHVRVTRGPKENRFRPAVDPLFRSAAYHYGPNVIGVILSGALDDGTSGLWTVKLRGGTAVVQDPLDAEVRSMPENAIRAVKVDYILPVAEIPKLLVRLVEQAGEYPRNAIKDIDENEDIKAEIELRVASGDDTLDRRVMTLGEGSPYACPECHGVLFSIRDGEKLRRFRCHTGHAFSTNSLLSDMCENIETSLWSVIRGIDETIIMLNYLGDHFAEVNDPKMAALYFQKAKEAQDRIHSIRRIVLEHENLSKDGIREEAANIQTTETKREAQTSA
jgi:two-component system, chemotaxis family, protein-glutamate methylesterase/glutaminase